MKKLLAGILAVLILLMPMAFAVVEKTTTAVAWNIATVVGFELTLLGESAVASTIGGAPTTGIEFNSSTGNDAGVEAKVVGGATQNSTSPIFAYENVGTVNLNLTVLLDSDPSVCITLNGGTTHPPATPISTSNVTVSTNLVPTGTVNWYMQSDFTACVDSDDSTATLTSYGNNS